MGRHSAAEWRTMRRIAAALVSLLACGCQSVREIPLVTLADLTDRPGLSAVGHAPPMRHAANVTWQVDASFVEADTDDQIPDHSFHVTFAARNDSASAIEFPMKSFTLHDDDGHRYTTTNPLLWVPEQVSYEPAPSTIAAYTSATLVAKFPCSSRLKLARLVHLTMRWRYSTGSKAYRVATRFRAR